MSVDSSVSHVSVLRARVVRVFLVLLGLTLAQVFWAIVVSDNFSTSTNAPIYIFLLMVKVYYMLAEFMHLRYEKKIFNLSMLVIPLAVLVWFVVSFCLEGSAGQEFKQKYGYDSRPAQRHVGERVHH